jgi:hypothetical protein
MSNSSHKSQLPAASDHRLRNGRDFALCVTAAFALGVATAVIVAWSWPVRSSSGNVEAANSALNSGTPLRLLQAASAAPEMPERMAFIHAGIESLLDSPAAAPQFWSGLMAGPLLEAASVVEKVELTLELSATLDECYWRPAGAQAIEELNLTRGLAASSLSDLADLLAIDVIAGQTSLANRLRLSKRYEDRVEILFAEEGLGLDSSLVARSNLLSGVGFYLIPSRVEAVRAATDDLTAALIELVDERLAAVAADTGKLATDAATPNSIVPSNESEIGPSTQAIIALDELANDLSACAVLDLAFASEEVTLEKLEGIEQRLADLIRTSLSVRDLRGESWALSRIYGAATSVQWPEYIGSVDPARLSPAVAALYNTTLNERLGSLVTPEARYTAVRRQMETPVVSMERF